MKWKKTIKVEKLKERIEPEGIGSGTGYCQYMKFKLYFDDGSETIMLVSDWHTDRNYKANEAHERCWELPISNPTETLFMILDQL